MVSALSPKRALARHGNGRTNGDSVANGFLDGSLGRSSWNFGLLLSWFHLQFRAGKKNFHASARFSCKNPLLRIAVREKTRIRGLFA
jgi:hypothetical protein